MMPTHQPDLKMDTGIFETLGESMRKTAAKEFLFWESAIETGIAGLDRIGGFQPGELTIVASEDNLITPRLLQLFIESVGVTQQLPVIIVRLGHGLRDLCCQLFRFKDPESQFWGINRSKTAEPNWSKLEALMQAPIYVTESITGADINYIDLQIERVAKTLGEVGLIVIEGIDYLNVWADTEYRSENPGVAWSRVSAEAKLMALSHKCPVILNTRVVNKDYYAEPLNNPSIRDLPYEGALANSADVVLIADRFSGQLSGRCFDLRTVFSRNGRYALVEMRHSGDTDDLTET